MSERFASSQFRYFVAISPGLEALLKQELDALGIASTATPGGVECRGPVEVMWTLNNGSRLAESVRLRLRPFRASTFEELERGFERLPWHAYLRNGIPFDVSVTSHHSRLYHTGAIEERVRRVVDSRFSKTNGSTSNHEKNSADATSTFAPRVLVRLEKDFVQVSVDTSGDRLHRRGYRQHVGDAPLRETLAAAAIQLLLADRTKSGFDVIWDPCCGSGTILGEWLLMRLSQSPGLGRRFAFEGWPIHDAGAYARWLNAKANSSRVESTARAYGSDIDPRAIQAANHNLTRAGLLERCRLFAEDFRAVEPHIPKGTAVVANLPYGVRLADKSDAKRLFSSLDRILRSRTDLRPALVLTTHSPESMGATATWKQVAAFANGGLRVRALRFVDATAPIVIGARPPETASRNC